MAKSARKFMDRQPGRRTTLWLAGCWLLAASAASADFYKYVGEDGVETFTNTPTSSEAVRILREPRAKSASKPAAAKPASKGAARAAGEAAAKGAGEVTAQVTATSLLAGELRAAQPLSAQPLSAQEPVLPVNGIVTSGYGWRHDPIDGGIRHHNGVDIAVPTGTKVKAIAAGRVVQSGWRGGYGNLVTLEHGDGSTSLYGHNSQLEVRVGDQVAAGQTLALSGSTGRSTGPHLHFELWRGGSNVTEAYLHNGAGIPEVAGSIRSYLHKDGSLVFTNLN